MFEVRTRWGRILLQVIVTLLVLPFLFPLVAMVQGSLAGDGWGNYAAVLAVPGLGRFFVNTVIIAAATIAIVYVVTMLAAYGFGKLRIRARRSTSGCCWPASRCPRWCSSRRCSRPPRRSASSTPTAAVILPLAALQVPFAVLLARNFVQGIPDELFEAARVDGGNAIRGFIHLVIPLTRPIAAAIVDLHPDRGVEQLPASRWCSCSPPRADDHPGAAVLRRPVQQRPDQDPRLRRHHRDPGDRRLPLPAAPVRARPGRRRHQVASRTTDRPVLEGAPCRSSRSTSTVSSSTRSATS